MLKKTITHMKGLYRSLKKISIRSAIKTVIFNLKYFDFKDAMKFPIHVYYKVEFRNLKGEIRIESPLKYGMIKLGYPGWTEFPMKNSYSVWNVRGNVFFKKDAILGAGSVIEVEANAELTFGEGFIMGGFSTIRCYKRVIFGNGSGMSWECLLMDSDVHPVMDMESHKVINPNKEIIIGDHVWIGCRVTILKGTKVGNMCVVAANSLLNKEIEGSNKIIGGNPARVLKENIVLADRITRLIEEFDS